MIEFNIRLKELRLAKNLSRKELAQILNISYAALSKYETGERTPDINNLVRLATYFEVSLDYLLNGCNTYPTGSYLREDLAESISLLEGFTKEQGEIALEQIKLIKKLNLKK